MEDSVQNNKQLFWNRKMIEKFIDLYKENVCLYDQSHENYNNNRVKSHAIKNIAQKMKEYLPNLELQDVQDKINVIRAQLSEEISVVNEAKLTGVKYEPKLWCYYQLEFLHKHLMNSASDSVLKVENPLPDDSHNYADNDRSEDSDVSLYTEIQNSRPKRKKIFWNRKMIEMFIQLYKEHECLYDANNINYDNHTLRTQALNSITENLQQFLPNLKLEDVEDKEKEIHSQLSEEISNMNEAETSGETYLPKLWCYDKLKFLQEHIANTTTICDDDDPSVEDSHNQICDDSGLLTRRQCSNNQSRSKYKWKRENLKVFIKLFKKFNLLYNPKHKYYLNRAVRHKAYHKLLKETKQLDSAITLHDVRDKIRILRNQYMTEVRRIKRALQNNEKISLRLWCFKMLVDLYNDDVEIKSYCESLNKTKNNNNILTTKHSNSTKVTNESDYTVNNEFDFEEINQVIEENVQECDEEFESLSDTNKIQTEQILNEPTEFQCVNTMEYYSEDIKPTKENCLNTTNNRQSDMEYNSDFNKRNMENGKHDWLGNLVVSQMREISENLHNEFAWDVQCLIRKYILKTSESRDKRTERNSSSTSGCKTNLPNTSRVQDLIIPRSSNVSLNISFQ